MNDLNINKENIEKWIKAIDIKIERNNLSDFSDDYWKRQKNEFEELLELLSFVETHKLNVPEIDDFTVCEEEGLIRIDSGPGEFRLIYDERDGYTIYVLNTNFDNDYAFLTLKDGRVINLHEKENYKRIIEDSFEVIDDEYVIFRADHYSGWEVNGVFSISKEEFVIPFEFTNIEFKDDLGLYYAEFVDTNWVSAGLDNYENNFAYLDSNFQFFQNIGIIKEKISEDLFILESENGSGYSLFNANSFKENTTDRIDYTGIEYYDFVGEKLYLTLKGGKEIEINIQQKGIKQKALFDEEWFFPVECEFLNHLDSNFSGLNENIKDHLWYDRYYAAVFEPNNYQRNILGIKRRDNFRTNESVNKQMLSIMDILCAPKSNDLKLIRGGINKYRTKFHSMYQGSNLFDLVGWKPEDRFPRILDLLKRFELLGEIDFDREILHAFIDNILSNTFFVGTCQNSYHMGGDAKFKISLKTDYLKNLSAITVEIFKNDIPDPRQLENKLKNDLIFKGILKYFVLYSNQIFSKDFRLIVLDYLNLNTDEANLIRKDRLTFARDVLEKIDIFVKDEAKLSLFDVFVFCSSYSHVGFNDNSSFTDFNNFISNGFNSYMDIKGYLEKRIPNLEAYIQDLNEQSSKLDWLR